MPTFEEAFANEQARARGMVVDDGGKLAFQRPTRFGRPWPAIAPPVLGADTAHILGAWAPAPEY